jgi:hypothetical protein
VENDDEWDKRAFDLWSQEGSRFDQKSFADEHFIQMRNRWSPGELPPSAAPSKSQATNTLVT